MVRSTLFLVPLALLVGAVYFFQHYEIHGLEHVVVRPRASGSGAAPGLEPLAPATRPGLSEETIRVASFNIQVFGQSKLSKPTVLATLADIARHFDVLAIQEVRSATQDVLPRFVEAINAGGVQYDFVIGDRLGRSNSKEQYAYVFNRATIEIDRTAVYTVRDEADLLHREPFVAAFRARGPPSSQAFTFTLINIHTDPDETDQELDVLDDVFRAVAGDGRREDDVILLGDLNVDDAHLGELGQVPYLTWTVSGVPTNTRGTAQYDNIVFDRRATIEFTGQAGIFDVMREYNLTRDQALEVSDHLPIWAEFSAYEGGRAGPLASRPDSPVTQ